MSDEPIVPRVPKPESLEAKFKLLSRLPYDRRAKRKHSLVFGFILDWYHSKYGDALASVRHVTATIKERDPAGVGLYAGDVHSALADLVAWGYLQQDKGIGRRASRYVPVWAKLDSVRENANATGEEHDEISVRENANAYVLEIPNATPDSVREIQNEDPLTPTRAPDPGTEVERQDCAAPTAPPAPPAIAAEPAGTAQDAQLEPFEQLWRAYGYKKNKREARRAYAKLAPDADLHQQLVEAARAWRESWAAQGNSTAPRFRLDKWIEREEYECDPPTCYKPKKAKESAKVKSREPAVSASVSERRELLTIVGSNVVEDCGEMTLYLDVVNEAGTERDISIFLQADDEKTQEEGQRIFKQLLAAVGLSECEDSRDLHGARFIRILRSKFGAYEYEPAPANDNARKIAA